MEYYQPPASHIDVALVDLTKLSSNPRLSFEKAQAGRYHVEDARGVRIADFNFTEEQPMSFALIGKGPFFIRTADKEALIQGSDAVSISAGDLEFNTTSAGSKGSVEGSFRRHLYEIPYGLSFFRGTLATRKNLHFDLNPPEKSESTRADFSDSKLRIIGWVSVGTGLLLGAGSGLMYYLASKSYGDYKLATTAEDAGRLKRLTQNRLLTSRIILGTGVALVATGATLLIIDAVQKKKAKSFTRQVVAAPSSNGFFFTFHQAF